MGEHSASLKPVKKVTAAGAAGAAAVVIVWIVGMFGVQVPAEVASALTVLAAFGGGYLKAA